MSTEVQDDIVFSNLLTLNFTYIQERLRKNFEIISSRMNKLEGLITLDDRVRTLEKESKFMSMKIDNMVLRLPESGANINEDDVRNICNDRIAEYMSPTNEALKSTKLFTELRAQLEKSILEKSTQRKKKEVVQEQSPQKKEKEKEGPTKTENSDQYAAVLSTGKVPRGVLEKHLNKQEMLYVDKLLKEQKPMEQILIETAAKLESLERHFEEARMSRGVLSMVQRDMQKFEKYQTYDQRYQRHEKKLKGTNDKTSAKQDMRNTTRDGEMKNTTREGQMRTTLREGDGRQTMKDQDPQRGSLAPNLTLKDSRKLGGSRKVVANEEIRYEEDQDPQRERMSRRNKSLSRLVMPERTERRLRLEDPKDINPIIREIENRLDNKVSKEVFNNLVQDMEERLQTLRYTRNMNSEQEVKRYCNSVENRLQAVISFIQQAQQDEDPLIAKKKWSCISCDKQAEKYSAKVGNHLNWDTLNAKRLSPTKAGAFGQTVLFASKVKSIIEHRKNAGDTSQLPGGTTPGE